MNTQILSFENIEADTLRREVNVNYILEGERKRLDIPFDHLTNFLTQHRVKVAGYNDDMGVEELDILWWSEQTLKNTTQAFIRNYEKFDLIVENRKLRDENSVLKSKVIMVRNLAVLSIHYIKPIMKKSWIERVFGFDNIEGYALEIFTTIKEATK